MFKLMEGVFLMFPKTCMSLLAIVILSFVYVMIRRRIAIRLGDKEVEVGGDEVHPALEESHADKV